MEVSTLPRATLIGRSRLLTLLPSGGQMPAKFLLLALWCPWTKCSVSVVSDIIKEDSRRCRSRQILNPKASLRGAWIQGRGVDGCASLLCPLLTSWARRSWARFQALRSTKQPFLLSCSTAGHHWAGHVYMVQLCLSMVSTWVPGSESDQGSIG